MYRFKIKVADHVIGVETVHTFTKSMCRDFICSGEDDFEIIISEQDIERYRKQNNENQCLTDGGLEFAVVLERIAERLLEENILLMHGAAVVTGESAYMFAARSGTGKTTHVLKWRDSLPDAFIVNGDKPFLKIGNDIRAYGTPWAGKESAYVNTSVPLKAIVLMERSDHNEIEKISFSEAFPMLLQQVYRPSDQEKLKKTLILLKQMSLKVAFFRFRFDNFQEDSFDVSYKALVVDN